MPRQTFFCTPDDQYFHSLFRTFAGKISLSLKRGFLAVAPEVEIKIIIPSSDDLDSAKTATCRTTVHWRAGRHQWVDGDGHLDLGSGSRKTSLSHCKHLPPLDTKGVSTSRPPQSLSISCLAWLILTLSLPCLQHRHSESDQQK